MLLDLFDAALIDRRDAPALDGVSLLRVHAGASRVAARFADLGVRRGDRVAIYCENRHGFVYSFLGALRLGAIAVPVNVLYRSADLAHVLSDAEPAIVVRSVAGARHLDDAGGAGTAVDAGEVEAWAADESLGSEIRRRGARADDVAAIVYTSGTTGRSKGAMLTHANLAAAAAALMAAWRWRADDTLLLALPLFHVHGLVAGLCTSLAAGSHVLLRERFDARDVLATLRRGEVTAFFGVPTMYVRLLEAVAAGAEPPAPIRLYVSGSAPLSTETFREFGVAFGAAILERYGATEFGFVLSNRYGGPRPAGSVGIPVPGASVRIAQPGGAAPLEAGRIGELLVRGPTVFAGYWRRPQDTADAFVADGDGRRWYRSGDLARYDAEHDVYSIAGRIKELIITGGFNVYPREIENAIEAFDGVRACAVIGKPDAARGELPVAFVEAEPPFDGAVVLDALRGRLASFKIPKEIHVVDELPRNAMGKLDKPALRARFEGTGGATPRQEG
ncbi:MAG TPA: AMP-binding protein [Candidatus Acidoferrales bacterium]|nr:AMP-binding protein [Candidatus Acidoferrales bacterium]